MAAILNRRNSKRLARSWGYLLLPIILWAWLIAQLGTIPIGIMSAFALLFFLFQASVPCGAQNRERDAVTSDFLFCRNNATGMLGGCHLKSHRWQNLKLIVHRSRWGQLTRNLFRKANGVAASLSAIATALSTVIAVGALVVSIVKPS